MNFSIGQKIVMSAVLGEIRELVTGRRGRTLAIVALEDGRTVKVDTRSIEDAATAIDSGFNPGQPKHGGRA